MSLTEEHPNALLWLYRLQTWLKKLDLLLDLLSHSSFLHHFSFPDVLLLSSLPSIPVPFPFLFTSLLLEGLSGSWKDNGSAGPFTPSSNSSSGGYWSWSAPSDQSNPSTPSPPLSADSFKPFRVPSVGGVGPGTAGPEDPSLDEQDGSSLLFDEPIPRKRKVCNGFKTVVHTWVKMLKRKASSASVHCKKPWWIRR